MLPSSCGLGCTGTIWAAMRRHLVTADGAELRPHDHTAWCGHGPRQLHRLASSVFTAAAQRNELMLLVSDEPRREWLTDLENVDPLLERGALRLIPAEEVYAYPADAAAQLGQFEAIVEQALADGYTGVSVVADNSRLVETSQDDFDAWLAWEAAADQLQLTRPIVGVCYFDLRRVPSNRMAELAAMHPVRYEGFPTPTFQIFCEGDALRVLGDLDAFHSHEVRRVVSAAVSVTGRELDISELEFIDHKTLLTLDEVARSGASVRLRGARSIVHRVWSLLDLTTPALEFS
jgi:MEDS: MEthanogen/methylotroph, DcmR Sensory domain